ncbi:type I restriction enzyme S subunit [Paenochrobactrum gallinarii]|uniref:Type I restriction enzyme S subunit n=1 Tax=Paenochrobactrum gallinarii TaxID=643673 RepID=A0A841LV49_9HYPH|nr:restriction endonuclease subunit S [Paenochrobactrum gallinarii]MBB6262225.1 type I restriction enzyme S subunit [Paenochrobactrum gallinarii]
MVPEGWKKRRLSDVATFRNGLNFLKDSGGQKVRVVGIPHFWRCHSMTSFGAIEPIAVGRLGEDDFLRSGDLLFVRSNGNKDLIGRCMYFPLVEEPVSFSGFTIRGRFNGDAALPEYVASLMRTRPVTDQISRGGGGTNISNLSQAILSSIIVCLPPLPEQKKIAEILSTWDKAIETTEKLLANAEAQKRALMQQLLTGKRRLKGFEGSEWHQQTLGNLGETYGGLTGKSKEDFGSGAPYITYMMVFGNSAIDLNKVEHVQINVNERQHRVLKNDIFFTTSSETPDEVGMSSILLDEPNECYLNSFCFGYRLHNYDALIPAFARHIFRGSVFRKDIRKLAQGATRYNLSKRELMKLKIQLPSLQEQKQISDILDTANDQIGGLNKHLAQIKKQKNALVQQLLTGKRRVTV